MPVMPQDQNPDKSAAFEPEAEKTEGKEYKSGALPKTAKYSVDKHGLWTSVP